MRTLTTRQAETEIDERIDLWCARHASRLDRDEWDTARRLCAAFLVEAGLDELTQVVVHNLVQEAIEQEMTD